MSDAGIYRFCLDRVRIGPDLEVDGWAFLERRGACRPSLVIDDRPASDIRVAFALPRRDVALALGDPAAERAGFRLAARLPDDAASISLSFEGPGAPAYLPILRRTGPGRRDWRILASPAPAAPEFRFLTDRGAAFARTTIGGGRLGAALAAFRDVPSPRASRPVSIVVPIFGGKPHLHTLARTLLERTDHRHPVILVDDANTDRAISAFLIGLRAAHDHITVVQMPENVGYVGAVSVGMELASRRDPSGHIVLLNSDTEVPEGWVERLIAPIEASSVAASVTPLTNAGTICGFPTMPADNPMFLGAGVEAIDAVFAGLDAPPIPVPTGVGFCMALSRRALDAIGFFDREAFGRGYGEEVDWCRRAEARGFVNLLAPNLFVRHEHGGSFPSEEKAAAIARAGAVISARHPGFDAEVQDFIAADPLLPARFAVATRLTRRLGIPGPLLVFDHGDAGGAVTVRRREVARAVREGRVVLLVRPAAVTRSDMPDAAIDIELTHRDFTLRLSAQNLDDLEALVREAPPSEIVINSLVGFERHAETIARVVAWKRAFGMPIRLLHNDYFPICPSFNLIDADDRHCGVPPLERCAVCAPRVRHARRDGASGDTPFDVVRHRRAWAELFAVVDRHVVFSRASLAVSRRVFSMPDERILVLPHMVEHMATRPLPPWMPSPDGLVRVAVVGGINVAKGANVVEETLRLIEARGLPLALELFGNIDRAFDSPRFRDNGPYDPADLPRLLVERNCGAIFLPPIWPETHCYVFDEVIGLGRPVVVFAIGAPAERARFHSNAVVVRSISAEAAIEALLRPFGRA